MIVLARGGGSFEDLLPFSDERVVRAVADVPRPGRLARSGTSRTRRSATSPPTSARRRPPPPRGSSSPTCASCVERLERSRRGLATGTSRLVDRDRQRLALAHGRLGRAPALLLERRRAALEAAAGRLRALSPRATLGRGYAIVRSSGAIVRSPAEVGAGDAIAVEVAEGSFEARVE